MKKKILINGDELEVLVKRQNADGVWFEYAGKEWHFKNADEGALYMGENTQTLKRFPLNVSKRGTTSLVAIGTRTFTVEDATSKSKKSAHHAGAMVSPMPGKILKVFKHKGDAVNAGETILVMEAMKMEHAIKASENGVIAKILKLEGEQVEGGVVLVELEESKA